MDSINTINIYDYWDEVIRYWRDNDPQKASIHPTQKFWFGNDQNHIKLLNDQLPEPYWGDIDCNSVVFINFNPGGAWQQCNWSNRYTSNTVSGYLSDRYSAKARTFGLLNDPFYINKGENGKNYEGTTWWRNRIKWLNQFGITSNAPSLMPFAIELCAWHSVIWSAATYKDPQLRQYIAKYFGPWIRQAIAGSKYKLALCIGKEFATKVFPIIWPGVELQNITAKIFSSSVINPVDNCMQLPDNDRKFWVFRVPEGHIVCTSTRGSNTMPNAEIFQPIEMAIYNYIK